jgi:D-tagatose-1,6-bisphosphate aldolase subunit GatZ/KbaZ
MVLEASMRATLPTQLPLLIEATCNQVNQDGGYTGMTPKDFRSFVEQIAAKTASPLSESSSPAITLAPTLGRAFLPRWRWRRPEVMISSFAAAGFSKLHLDCSMGCQGEPVALKDEETASRAARLAAAAESALPGGEAPKPVYVIGTEVPIPGGAMHALDELELTTPEDALRTVQVHETAFAEEGQSDAFTRVIAAVVQPGVEFGSHNVVDYNSSKAEALSATLKDMPA